MAGRIKLIGWLNDQIVACGEKCWIKMFDLDHTLEFVIHVSWREAVKHLRILVQHDI